MQIPYFSTYKPLDYLSLSGFFDRPICERAYPRGGRGAYMMIKEKVSETTDIIRQSENLYLKK